VSLHPQKQPMKKHGSLCNSAYTFVKNDTYLDSIIEILGHFTNKMVPKGILGGTLIEIKIP